VRSREVAAVPFDIDGTLVDTTRGQSAFVDLVGAHLGVDADQILRVCDGRRTIETVALFVPARHRREAAESGPSDRERHFDQAMQTST
jgi:sugar-phosphatase